MGRSKPKKSDGVVEVCQWLESLPPAEIDRRKQALSIIKEATLEAYESKDPDLLLESQEIADKMGVERSTIGTLLSHLVKEGVTARTRTGRAVRYYVTSEWLGNAPENTP